MTTPAPSHIFEVVYSPDRLKKWEDLHEDHKIITAFHGTAVQNIHSILHNGLISHLNKVLCKH